MQLENSSQTQQLDSASQQLLDTLQDIVSNVQIHSNFSISHPNYKPLELPDEVVARFQRMPGDIQNKYLSLQLRSFLYGIYYNASMRAALAPSADSDAPALHQDLENNTRLGVDTAFYERLHSSNQGSGYFDSGWSVMKLESDRTLAVTKGGLTLYVQPEKHLQFPEKSAAVSELVAIRMPRNFVQNGFYMAVSNAGPRSYSHPSRQPEIVRIYFNFSPEGAVAVMGSLTRELNDIFIPFTFKVLYNPGDYKRYDSGVLYFEKSNYEAVRQVLESVYGQTKAYQATFPIALAELLGMTLAKLHSQTMSSQKCHTFLTELEESKLNYQLPYPDYLSDYLISRIEPESLNKAQAVSWRFLGNFQQSEVVREIVTELVLNHRHCCLTHNNIQFQKIFIPTNWEKLVTEIQDSDQSPIKIVDWEACSWGDPACDLGKAILGYFLFWLNSMIVHPAIDIKKSIQLATIPLEVVRPSIVAMTKAYINTYPKILEDYPDFLKRVIQFTGLGLIYQLLAEFQLQPEMALSHQGLYFFIATQLLCKPEKFLSI